MKYQELCKSILSLIGGKDNITEVTHCMTRLRIALKDVKKADLDALDRLEGTMGAVLKCNQIQIVIGSDINRLCKEFLDYIDYQEGSGNKSKGSSGKGSTVERATNALASIFNPIVPALAGSGMIKAFLVILKLTGLLAAESETYMVLNTLSDAVFYFLPMLLAYSASRVFKCNSFVAVALAGTLMHPNFVNLIAEGTSQVHFLGLPINLMSYSSSVLPTVLGVWFMSYIERIFDRIIPGAFKIVFVPAFTLMITAPVTLMVVGPLASLLGNYIGDGVSFLFEKGGIFAGIVLGGLQSTLVVAGLQHSILPLQIDAIARMGYNNYSPVSGNANVAQAGASFGVWLKSKNKNNKTVAASACVSALLGISEPAVYGVTLRLKRPFLAAAIGSAAGGAIAAAFHCEAYAIGGPSFATLPMFISDTNPYNVFIVAGAFCVSFIISTIMTCIFGFQEEVKDTVQIEHTEHRSNKDYMQLGAPVSGEIIPLCDVQDAAFASGKIGDGIAIEPDSNSIYSPVDGTVAAVYSTGHAIGIRSLDGVDILIHIGIDTVRLGGKHFIVKVEKDDVVKRGDLLCVFDYQKIREEGFIATVLMVITNKKDFPNYKILDRIHVDKNEDIIEVDTTKEMNV